MFILCDTSSILMLLRIAPDMFTDERYGCKTIREVHDEIVRTTKFKSKYPWTRGMRPRVRPLVLGEQQKHREAVFFDAIRALNLQGTVNKKTERFFDLSHEDMRLISHALALGYKISSGDRELKEFARQEFAADFRGSISPFEIINQWLESGIISWDEEKQRYLSAWADDREHPQPLNAKKHFKALSGSDYSGS
ncbi:MAG: hypothetical protein GF331_13070 [Chitinivibrionales bacterium]|nr:hypothetical protein [Chitinivibrionales bacterium]